MAHSSLKPSGPILDRPDQPVAKGGGSLDDELADVSWAEGAATRRGQASYRVGPSLKFVDTHDRVSERHAK
jgi:hypothetical protein